MRVTTSLARVVDPESSGPARAMQWHDALLATLTQYPQQALAYVDAARSSPHSSLDAQARAVEHLAHRAVQRRPRVVAPIVVEQFVELFAHHDLGQPRDWAAAPRVAPPGCFDVAALKGPREVATSDARRREIDVRSSPARS